MLEGAASSYRLLVALIAGSAIGVLGGLIGLGGAEFRLLILIGVFGFDALSAVNLNKAMSMVVVAFSIPFRMGAIPFEDTLAHWPIVVSLLAGTCAGRESQG